MNNEQELRDNLQKAIDDLNGFTIDPFFSFLTYALSEKRVFKVKQCQENLNTYLNGKTTERNIL